MSITNEEYESAMAIVAQKDAQIVTETLSVLDQFKSCVAEPLTAMRALQDGLPKLTNQGQQTPARAQMESIFGQLQNLVNQLEYMRTSIAAYSAVPSTRV